MSTAVDGVHRVGLHITRDHRRSGRNIKIKPLGIPVGPLWVYDGEDYEALATKWIAACMEWPEHLVDAYNVNGASG
jgi:hypothetical protein